MISKTAIALTLAAAANGIEISNQEKKEELKDKWQGGTCASTLYKYCDKDNSLKATYD